MTDRTTKHNSKSKDRRRKIMKKRILSILLTAALTTGMLAGCGGQSGGNETERSDSGAIVLDMYHSWSTDTERGAALDKLIQQFNEENEGKIEVKVTINPDLSLWTLRNIWMTSGEPDLARETWKI